MKKLILIILLLPLLTCSQTKVKDIQTVKIANNITMFGERLPQGTLVLDMSTYKTYYLTHASNADETISSSAAATGLESTGLESITESGKQGWRLIGLNPNLYGETGDQAVDLSIGYYSNNTLGATGDYSFASGKGTAATE